MITLRFAQRLRHLGQIATGRQNPGLYCSKLTARGLSPNTVCSENNNGCVTAIAAQTIEYTEFGSGTVSLTTPLIQENHNCYFFRCCFHGYSCAPGWFVEALADDRVQFAVPNSKKRTASPPYSVLAFSVTPRDSSTISAATESPLA